MDELQGITALVCLGMAAQWLAWRLRMPSILLLLLFGFFSGSEWLDLGISNLLDANVLFPFVSVSVGIILFEGGLSLRLSEFRSHGRTVTRLVTVGALVTWVLATLGARLLVGFEWDMAILVGAILIVSGPTVVLPLLSHINPVGRTGPILKWEGIAIDPVGATIAVLVYEGLDIGRLGEAAGHGVLGMVKTILVGGGLGLLAGYLLVLLIRKRWIPDHLQSPIALALVVAAFALSHRVQHESGLLAVTVMGVFAANAKSVSVSHILEFKENLRVLLISSLFLLLASRVTLADLGELHGGAFAFLAALILVVRPVAVFLSARGSRLSVKEKIFLAWLCPRGIVAAAVASVFSLNLMATQPQARMLVPVTFLVIVGTVVVYGLTAGPLARRLGLAVPNPQGVLFIGAHRWARDIALALQAEGLSVLLVDANRANVGAARLAGLPVKKGNALDESFEESLTLPGIGRVLALTPNDEVNTLAALNFRHQFGRSETYQLVPDTVPRTDAASTQPEHGGRGLFREDADFFELSKRATRGKVRVTALTEQFDLESFRAHHGDKALELFALQPDGKLVVATAEEPLRALAGARIVALVDDAREPDTAAPA